MATRPSKNEILGIGKKKRSLDDILVRFSPAAQHKILSLREIHSCLMELPKQTIDKIQCKALYKSYIEGTARRLTTELNTRTITEEDGFTYEVKSYFKYRNI